MSAADHLVMFGISLQPEHLAKGEEMENRLVAGGTLIGIAVLLVLMPYWPLWDAGVTPGVMWDRLRDTAPSPIGAGAPSSLGNKVGCCTYWMGLAVMVGALIAGSRRLLARED